MTQAEYSEASRGRHAKIRFSARESGKPSSVGPALAAALAAKDTIR